MIIVPFFSLAVFGSLLSGYAVFVEPRIIMIAEYEIMSNNLPETFDGTRIALITDIHHGSLRTYDLLDQMVSLIMEQSPDLILLGGDYAREHQAALNACFTKLSELEAPLGVYAVLGNHDYWDLPQMRQAIADAGILLLENEAVWLEEGGKRILLVGAKDLWCDQQSLAGQRRKLAESDFTILLSHNPDNYDATTPTDRKHIDLMLSGHTHGGQVTLFGFYAPVKTAKAEYTSGYVQSDDGRTHIVVSNGVGTVGLPIRFFARPQIVLVTLKKSP
ncbi:MAG: metallophosphoesterase [Planctomycetaceae bacterium]|nr:metallophosphoesterase [Planctomycetaceae bacterium]